jgi:hypothetical protein
MKVFLGGTCNDSKWRDNLIKLINTEYFNPVADDWTPECMAEEIRQRSLCDVVLYVVTPKMTGTYAIAEAVDDSNKRPNKTIFMVLDTDEEMTFSVGQKKSLAQVSDMIAENGGLVFACMLHLARHLNIRHTLKRYK